MSTLTWTEQHRPHTLDSISSQSSTINTLKSFLTSTNIPNFLFFGPQGTGKTTAINAFARELFGSQFKSRVVEINSSAERGVNEIRTRVKPLCQRKISSGIQLLILEEADALTRDAQAALRRILEDSASTRVCLLCNYVSQIIDPLASRCVKFRFFPLPNLVIQAKLKLICGVENVIVDEFSLQKISQNSRGDMRKAVTDLQIHAQIGRKIIDKNVCCLLEKIQGGVENQFVIEIFNHLTNREIDDSQVKAIILKIQQSEIAPNQLVLAVFDMFLASEEVGDSFRKICASEFAKFSIFCARRGSEKLALSRFLWGCRCGVYK